jgi:hypothetical protein
MDDRYFRVLEALDIDPRTFEEVCIRAGVKPSLDAAESLFALIKVGLVCEDGQEYALTDDGVERLQLERQVKYVDPKNNTTKEPGSSFASGSSRLHSSTPAPKFRYWRDRYGNFAISPINRDEK